MGVTQSLFVIAAICGNFWQESTVNPGIWENLTVGAPGYGLGQWTDNPPVVERRTVLFNWLDASGYARDSGEGQLAFLVHENIWVSNGARYPSDYASLSDFFDSQSTDLEALTYEWFHHWEGIEDGTGPVRYAAARRFMNVFAYDDGTRNPWYASNAYLTEAQADSNALLIKDWFLGTTPTPPVPPVPKPKKRKMPPWMILYFK